MNKLLYAVILIGSFAIGNNAVWAATTLLPPGMQCFTTATGAVVSGSVDMFFVGTTTPKPTWQDGNQNTLNSQPIQLDANGCATIYGIGAYRQRLFDGPVVGGVTTGNLIFDKVTTDTSAFNSTFWAGIAGGTPNVITVVDTGFNGTDGTVINFTALATNTGAATLNPSGFGAFSIVKDTAGGPVSLAGGEIVQNNIISVVFSASGNNFHLLNTAIPSAAGTSAPLCGASNLKIVNNTGTPSSIITITADDAVLTTSAGLVVHRTNVSQNINISTGTITSTAGGMDGEAPGTSAWLDLFLIDNGAAPAGLASVAAANGKSPNMPSGYTYKCYFGAMRVDGAGNLLRTIQRGAKAQYTVVTASNTAALPNMANGSAGTYSTTVPVWAAVATGAFVPPTASSITLIVTNKFKNGAGGTLQLAPNNNYGGGFDANGDFPWLDNAAVGTSVMWFFEMQLESTNIFWTSSAAGGAISAAGWRDQVNAN